MLLFPNKVIKSFKTTCVTIRILNIPIFFFFLLTDKKIQEKLNDNETNLQVIAGIKFITSASNLIKNIFFEYTTYLRIKVSGLQ